jgi:uncharacterized membrane protein
MTYLSGSQLRGPLDQPALAATKERRVRAAIAVSQALLVLRIMTVLMAVSFLPAKLPSITIGLDASHTVTLPLAGLSGGLLLLLAAVVSSFELYLVYRLADRARSARVGILAIESIAILACATALAVGAAIAALPLVASIVACTLLLRNQVRWAFRLQGERRSLTGRRQGGVFAGYAAPGLDAPKLPQRVGYSSGRSPKD